jgi:hypothetical protein
MSEETKKLLQDQTQQALDNYDQVVRTELSVHEEFARAWRAYLATTTVPDPWLTKSNRGVSQMVPGAQEAAEESLRLFEERSRAGLELLQQSLRVANADCLNAVLEELQLMLEASLAGFRSSAHSIIQFNEKAVVCWALLFSAGGLASVKSQQG